MMFSYVYVCSTPRGLKLRSRPGILGSIAVATRGMHSVILYTFTSRIILPSIWGYRRRRFHLKL